MFQISNLEPEWNVNETHIIIPMIDGNLVCNSNSDLFARSTMVINPLDGIEPTVLSNGLEHSFVIGLDRNLFESQVNKSDLLVIQNPDLKLLPCNPELRNPPIAYTLTYLDQDRNEIIWGNPIRDWTKPDWYLSDKPIFEVKDVLTYADSVQDLSRNWQDVVGKSTEQINFNVGADITSQVSKIDEILMPAEDEISAKKSVSGDSHFLVNYCPIIQGCEEGVIMSNSAIVNAPKQVTNLKKKSGTTKNKSKSDKTVKKSLGSSKCAKSLAVQTVNESNSDTYNKDKEMVSDSMPQKDVKEHDESLSTTTNLSDYIQNEMKRILSEKLQNIGKKKPEECNNKTITFTGSSQNITNMSNIINTNEVKSSLPEKSLPLKKKAKMKRTVDSDNIKLVLRKDIDVHKQSSDDTQITNEWKTKFQSKGDLKIKIMKFKIHQNDKKNSSSTDSKEPLITRIKRTDITTKLNDTKAKVKGEMSKKISVEKTKRTKRNCKSRKKLTDSAKLRRPGGVKIKIFTLNKKKFKTIYDLVEGLKKCKMINPEVGRILHSGLKEMNVDILKEMNSKLNCEAPVESASYSPQLKAFALMLYFKQPAAFNHLGRLYQNGWPSLSVIKDWKRRMNSQQKGNFFKPRRKVEQTNLYGCNEM